MYKSSKIDDKNPILTRFLCIQACRPNFDFAAHKCDSPSSLAWCRVSEKLKMMYKSSKIDDKISILTLFLYIQIHVRVTKVWFAAHKSDSLCKIKFCMGNKNEKMRCKSSKIEDRNSKFRQFLYTERKREKPTSQIFWGLTHSILEGFWELFGKVLRN